MADIKKMVAEIRKQVIDSGAMEIARSIPFSDISAMEANAIADAVLGYEMDHEELDSEQIEDSDIYTLSANLSFLGEQYAPPTDILNAMGVKVLDPADYQLTSEQREQLSRGWDIIDEAKGAQLILEQQYALLLESAIAKVLGQTRAA